MVDNLEGGLGLRHTQIFVFFNDSWVFDKLDHLVLYFVENSFLLQIVAVFGNWGWVLLLAVASSRALLMDHVHTTSSGCRGSRDQQVGVTVLSLQKVTITGLFSQLILLLLISQLSYNLLSRRHRSGERGLLEWALIVVIVCQSEWWLVLAFVTGHWAHLVTFCCVHIVEIFEVSDVLAEGL